MGTNYAWEFDWFVPKTGQQLVLKDRQPQTINQATQQASTPDTPINIAHPAPANSTHGYPAAPSVNAKAKQVISSTTGHLHQPRDVERNWYGNWYGCHICPNRSREEHPVADYHPSLRENTREKTNDTQNQIFEHSPEIHRTLKWVVFDRSM